MPQFTGKSIAASICACNCRGFGASSKNHRAPLISPGFCLYIPEIVRKKYLFYMFQGFDLYFQASGFHFQKLGNTFCLPASGIQPAFSFRCQNPDFLKKIKGVFYRKLFKGFSDKFRMGSSVCSFVLIQISKIASSVSGYCNFPACFFIVLQKGDKDSRFCSLNGSHQSCGASANHDQRTGRVHRLFFLFCRLIFFHKYLPDWCYLQSCKIMEV